MNKKMTVKTVAYFSTILILVLAILFSGLRILESTVLLPGQNQESSFATKTIERNGKAYFPRQDITVMMVLGIDEFGPVKDSGSYNNPGAADMVVLLVFDETEEVCDILCLNRDTMVEMPVLGIGGKKAGTLVGQLALSHTYGSGLEDSCENTRETVSDFLYGIQIDHYASFNMDAITLINDAVGGVTVTVTDDFSDVDPTITEGEITLKGEQAINFVRTRKGVGDQKNISRIERQKEYMEGFLEAFGKKSGDEAFFLSAYEEIEPYVVTDCSATALSGIVSRYGDYALGEVISPEGENILGGEYYEFHVDEEALDELILELFYAEKQ